MADEEQEGEPGEIERNRLEELEERQQRRFVSEVRQPSESESKAHECQDEDVRVTKAVDNLFAVPDKWNSKKCSKDIDERLRSPLIFVDNRMLNDVDGEDMSESFLDEPQSAEDKRRNRNSRDDPFVALQSRHWDGEHAALGVPPPIGRREWERSKRKVLKVSGNLCESKSQVLGSHLTLLLHAAFRVKKSLISYPENRTTIAQTNIVTTKPIIGM